MYNSGSETMRILGEQRHFDYITPEVMQELQEIFESNIAGRGHEIHMLLSDVFIWGYINGVRGERAKRAGRESNAV